MKNLSDKIRLAETTLAVSEAQQKCGLLSQLNGSCLQKPIEHGADVSRERIVCSGHAQ